MRHLALPLLLTTLTAGAALAKPVPPNDGAMIVQQAPPAIEIVGRGSRVDGHVLAHGGDLVQCARFARATYLRVTVVLRWDDDGRITRANASAGGTTAAFRRCATRALSGQLSGFDPMTDHRGIGRTVVAIRKPTATKKPTPKPPAKDTLQFCQVDADCTVYFRTSSCVPRDPIAVNAHDLKAVVAKYGHKDDPCAMGGPQYEKLRRQNEGRWTASCVQQTCTLQEHDKSGEEFPL